MKKQSAFNPDQALSYAFPHGHLKAVKVLLGDEVDPSAWDQKVLRLTSEDGHVEVVKVLPADDRANPSAGNQGALWLAS